MTWTSDLNLFGVIPAAEMAAKDTKFYSFRYFVRHSAQKHSFFFHSSAIRPNDNIVIIIIFISFVRDCCSKSLKASIKNQT